MDEKSLNDLCIHNAVTPLKTTTRLTFGEVCGFNVGNNEVVGTGVETGADDGDKGVVASKEMEDEVSPPRKTANNKSRMNMREMSVLKRFCFHQGSSGVAS
jgi:hypothetical protein